MLQRRGNMQNVLFSSHVARWNLQLRYYLSHYSQLCWLILKNSILFFFSLHAHRYISLHVCTHTGTHSTTVSTPAFRMSDAGKVWAHLSYLNICFWGSCFCCLWLVMFCSYSNSRKQMIRGKKNVAFKQMERRELNCVVVIVIQPSTLVASTWGK